jgi:hypothetical protein
VLLWIIGGAACACAVAVVCWYFASIYGTSARKGKALFAAYLFLGSGICVATLASLGYYWHLPVFGAEGNIEAVRVHGGKSQHTDLLIRTASGGEIALHAPGTSPHFRLGEHVKVRYQGETGYILKALFVSADGREEGVFNGTGAWPLYFFLLVGAKIIFQGFRTYRRDPEGAEEPSAPNQHPYGSIDQRSLLSLSEDDTSEWAPECERKGVNGISRMVDVSRR